MVAAGGSRQGKNGRSWTYDGIAGDIDPFSPDSGAPRSQAGPPAVRAGRLIFDGAGVLIALTPTWCWRAAKILAGGGSIVGSASGRHWSLTWVDTQGLRA